MKKQTVITATLGVLLVLFIAAAAVAYSIIGDGTDRDAMNVYGKDDTAVSDGGESDSDGTAEDGTDTSEYTAPDFTVTDIDGNKVRLSDFFGTPIVLNFWASWCGPCKSEMPHFNEAAELYSGDVVFLMVNMTDGSRETVWSASSYIENQGYTFPVFYDTDMDAAMTYSVYSLPTTYFVDADGNLVAQATGAIDADTLKRGIDMIYPESAVASEE